MKTVYSANDEERMRVVYRLAAAFAREPILRSHICIAHL